MPNWKNKAEYEWLEKATRTEWVWQFLRRNAQYRADFEAANQPGEIYDPPKNPGETDSQWRHRALVEVNGPRKVNRQSFYAEKWQILPPLPDPANGEAPRFRREYPRVAAWDEIDKFFVETNGERVPENFALVAFDLRYPIEISESLQSSLERLQKFVEARTLRNQSPKWIAYLRVLDALDSGASSAEIRSVMKEYEVIDGDKHRSSDRYSDHKKAAEQLQADPLSVLK
jgi:hypothetical protein